MTLLKGNSWEIYPDFLLRQSGGHFENVRILDVMLRHRCGRQICFCMLLIRGKHAKRPFVNENDKERDPMLFNDVQDKKGSASVLKYERK